LHAKVVEEFLDKPSRGVVLFSLGSNMRSDVLGAEKIAMIMKAFEKLPELNFIWKFESETKIDVPKNVLTVDWVSQNDILGNKKTCISFLKPYTNTSFI
jgi:glucuronosyltransferase